MDYVVLGLTKALATLLNLLPLTLQDRCIYYLVRLAYLLLPKLVKVSAKNIALAFPELSSTERHELLLESQRSLARVAVDVLRAPTLDQAWAKENLAVTGMDQVRSAYQTLEGKGMLCAVGHLSSFEVLLKFAPNFISPIATIIRPLKLNALDRWWSKSRKQFGNQLIPRTGAIKRARELLQTGISVSIPFDQNVRDKYAVFVPWFGRDAATTKALGTLALQLKIPVVVGTIQESRRGKYVVDLEVLYFNDVYAKESMSEFDKIREITLRVSAVYEQKIRQAPATWFWMHKRWRTICADGDENFYADC